jgi:hypothetical protein
MTDQQLYLASGLPSLVALAGILVNVTFFVALIRRVSSLETRLVARMDRLESSVTAKLSF